MCRWNPCTEKPRGAFGRRAGEREDAKQGSPRRTGEGQRLMCRGFSVWNGSIMSDSSRRVFSVHTKKTFNRLLTTIRVHLTQAQEGQGCTETELQNHKDKFKEDKDKWDSSPWPQKSLWNDDEGTVTFPQKKALNKGPGGSRWVPHSAEPSLLLTGLQNSKLSNKGMLQSCKNPQAECQKQLCVSSEPGRKLQEGILAGQWRVWTSSKRKKMVQCSYQEKQNEPEQMTTCSESVSQNLRRLTN